MDGSVVFGGVEDFGGFVLGGVEIHTGVEEGGNGIGFKVVMQDGVGREKGHKAEEKLGVVSVSGDEGFIYSAEGGEGDIA